MDLYNYVMNLDTAVKTINLLLEKEQPKHLVVHGSLPTLPRYISSFVPTLELKMIMLIGTDLLTDSKENI